MTADTPVIRRCSWCPFQTSDLDEMYRHSVREHGDELWHEEADRG